MKMNDIRDILNKRQHAIFLATPLRDPAVRGGRVVITSISDTGKSELAVSPQRERLAPCGTHLPETFVGSPMKTTPPKNPPPTTGDHYRNFYL
jgi:hypothetical protein